MTNLILALTFLFASYIPAPNAHRFSRFGDSNSMPAVYMGHYERGYPWDDDLNETAEYFKGSFARQGLANNNGWSVLDGLEHLDEEIAAWQPSIALISYGANWNGSAQEHTDHLRELVERLLDYGVLPVLSTVTGNPNPGINRGIRQVAEEYDIPLFDWEPIGRNYLSEDGVHLTVEGWNVHSYYGLLMLDEIRKE